MEIETKSEILSEEQVTSIVNNTPLEQKEEVLPSEEGEVELIGGKFKSQDDLLKAYNELQSKLGKPKEEVVEEQPQQVDEEYETYKQQKAQKELLDPIGGVEVYNTAIKWAADNLPKEQIDKYNKLLEEASGNTDTIQALAENIILKYNNSNTTREVTPTPSIHSGETAKIQKATGYSTKSDMMKDMSDIRYSKDPSFRDKVSAKVALTDESSWYKGISRGM